MSQCPHKGSGKKGGSFRTFTEQDSASYEQWNEEQYTAFSAVRAVRTDTEATRTGTSMGSAGGRRDIDSKRTKENIKSGREIDVMRKKSEAKGWAVVPGKSR